MPRRNGRNPTTRQFDNLITTLISRQASLCREPTSKDTLWTIFGDASSPAPACYMKRSDIWYHLYPLGFLGAEDRNASPGDPAVSVSHRLKELIGWLDYLVDLGVTGLLLGPIFESESHGYDTVDALKIDQRLGSESDLADLIDACHSRSLAVALDLVLDHVGRGHPHFADVLAHGRDSAWCDWFVIDFDKPGYDGFSYDTFEGHGDLVKLNHSNPRVLDWAVDVARHWMDRGVDAFRLDAAYAIPSQFLASFADRIAAVRSDVVLLGEVIHGDYVSIAEASHLATLTQYELWKAIWSSLNDRNFYELAHSLDRHVTFCQSFPPWNFVGNHDTTRIASKLNDPRDVAHALAVLLTIPGIPAIYAGDEQGAKGVKYDRPGGDAEIRKPLPCRPEDIIGQPTPIWQLHRDLIAIRRERPWIADGQLEVTHVDNASITYRVRSGQNQLWVTLNTDDRAMAMTIPAGLVPVAGDALSTEGSAELPAHAWGIWASP